MYLLVRKDGTNSGATQALYRRKVAPWTHPRKVLEVESPRVVPKRLRDRILQARPIRHACVCDALPLSTGRRRFGSPSSGPAERVGSARVPCPESFDTRSFPGALLIRVFFSPPPRWSPPRLVRPRRSRRRPRRTRRSGTYSTTAWSTQNADFEKGVTPVLFPALGHT